MPCDRRCLPPIIWTHYESAGLQTGIDDRPVLKIEDERAYQMLWELVDRIETFEAVREGLGQMERGEGRPAEDVFEDMRKRHRLPRAE